MNTFVKLMNKNKNIVLGSLFALTSALGMAQEKKQGVKSDSILKNEVLKDENGKIIKRLLERKTEYYPETTKSGDTLITTKKDTEYKELLERKMEEAARKAALENSNKKYPDPRSPAELKDWMQDGTKGSDYLSQYPKVYSQSVPKKGEDLDDFVKNRWNEKELAYLKYILSKMKDVKVTNESEDLEKEKIINNVIEKVIREVDTVTIKQQPRIVVQNDKYMRFNVHGSYKADLDNDYRLYENTGYGVGFNTGNTLSKWLSIDLGVQQYKGVNGHDFFTMQENPDPLDPRLLDDIPYRLDPNGNGFTHTEGHAEAQFMFRIGLFEKKNDLINNYQNIKTMMDLSQVDKQFSMTLKPYVAGGVFYRSTNAEHSTINDGTGPHVGDNSYSSVLIAGASAITDGNYKTENIFGEQFGLQGRFGLQVEVDLVSFGKDKLDIRNADNDVVTFEEATALFASNDDAFSQLTAKRKTCPTLGFLIDAGGRITNLNTGKGMNIYDSPNGLTIPGLEGQDGPAYFAAGNTRYNNTPGTPDNVFNPLPAFNKTGEQFIDNKASLDNIQWQITAGISLKF